MSAFKSSAEFMEVAKAGAQAMRDAGHDWKRLKCPYIL